MTTPDFIGVTQSDILTDLITDYETRYLQLTGETRVLYPMQVEYLVLENR